MHNALLQNKAKIMGNGCYATSQWKKILKYIKCLRCTYDNVTRNQLMVNSKSNSN